MARTGSQSFIQWFSGVQGFGGFSENWGTKVWEFGGLWGRAEVSEALWLVFASFCFREKDLPKHTLPKPKAKQFDVSDARVGRRVLGLKLGSSGYAG